MQQQPLTQHTRRELSLSSSNSSSSSSNSRRKTPLTHIQRHAGSST
jgi:hypothetical protein